MAKNLALFDNKNLDRVYYYPDGRKITGKQFIEGIPPRFPGDPMVKGYEAAADIPYIIKISKDNVISRVDSLYKMIAMYNIDDNGLSDEELLDAVEEYEAKRRLEQEEAAKSYVDPNERLAAAIEFQNLLNM